MKTLKDIQEEVLKEFDYFDEKFRLLFTDTGDPVWEAGIEAFNRGEDVGSKRKAIIKDFIAAAGLTYARSALEAVEIEKQPEIRKEECVNCGDEAWGKAWYGHGKATGSSWGDRYIPLGSVAFCLVCASCFPIGKEYDGERIWKTTSELPEHSAIRENAVTFKDSKAVAFNEAIQKVEERKKAFLGE